MVSKSAPRGLKSRGRKLWRDLTERYEFDEHEVPVLLELCRVLDRIDALEQQIVEDGLMVAGSTGQRVLHPAIPEQRQQQVTASRLVTQLNIPVEEGGTALTRAVSAQAKSAANARWNRSKGARRA